MLGKIPAGCVTACHVADDGPVLAGDVGAASANLGRAFTGSGAGC